MIRTETTSDGRRRTWSDAGMMIRQEETGALYEDAVDVQPVRYTYTETSTPILHDNDEATDEDYVQALVDLGVNL